LATDVVMPQMGESIAEGTIVRWIKKVGDPIDKDEPLFEISTDKVDAEIPSPGAGIVLYHADLYRLSPREVDDLGLGELSEDGILAVEWPDRWRGDARALPPTRRDTASRRHPETRRFRCLALP